MKFESKPVEVDAMQWNGDPEALLALLNWIMADRVSDHLNGSSPIVHYSRRWGPHSEMQGQPEATLEGHRWHVHLEVGHWVIKQDSGVHALPDERFKEIYKQKRSKR